MMSILDERLDGARRDVAIFRMSEFNDAATDQLRAGIAEHLSERVIDMPKVEVAPNDDHANVRIGKRPPELFLGLSQAGFDPGQYVHLVLSGHETFPHLVNAAKGGACLQRSKHDQPREHADKGNQKLWRKRW
jgi:hypothetical protein